MGSKATCPGGRYRHQPSEKAGSAENGMRVLTTSAAALFWTQVSLCALAGMGVPARLDPAPIDESSDLHANAVGGNGCAAESHAPVSHHPGEEPGANCSAHCDLLIQALTNAVPAVAPPTSPPARLDASRLAAALPITAARAYSAFRLPSGEPDLLLAKSTLLI